MNKRKSSRYFRGIRYANELRQYYKSPEYVRAKRNPTNLPTDWDDIRSCIQRSWKVKRKKQYRGRSKNKCVVFLPINIKSWDLGEHLEDHDIPFNMEYVTEQRTNSYHPRKQVKDEYVPVYTYKYQGKGHQIGWAWTYKTEVDYTQKIDKTYTYITGYKLTYWSDKEINLGDFIEKH